MSRDVNPYLPVLYRAASGGGSSDHTELSNIGTNTHAEIDTALGISVTAAAVFSTDNVLLRADGTSRGAQKTGITVADTTDKISLTGMSLGYTVDATAAYTATLADHHVIMSAATATLTLPAASAAGSGFPLLVRLTGATSRTIAATGGDTVDVTAPEKDVTYLFVSDGTSDWAVWMDTTEDAGQVTLTSGATVTPAKGSHGKKWLLVAGETLTIANPTGFVAGDGGVLILNPVTYTISWGASWAYTGAVAPTLTASQKNTVAWYYDGTLFHIGVTPDSRAIV